MGVKETWAISFQWSVGTGQREAAIDSSIGVHQYAKEFIHSKGDRVLEQTAQRVVESASLEIFKTHLAAYLCSLL